MSPNCTNLLCRFHINKNVEAKCKVLIGTDDFALSVMENWKYLIYAETVEQFDEEWKEMCVMCKDFPDFISYISTTWLKHKEKFVSAWTNSVLHFGTTTSNRYNAHFIGCDLSFHSLALLPEIDRV